MFVVENTRKVLNCGDGGRAMEGGQCSHDGGSQTMVIDGGDRRRRVSRLEISKLSPNAS